MVNKRSITPSLTEDEKVAFIAGSHREKGLNLGSRLDGFWLHLS